MIRTPRRSRNAVTMHEVAKHVGVSPMTVSRVISGDANVRAETLQRVREAIRQLGYTPNVAARNLAKAATVHIGLLYKNPSAAYLNELLVGVLEQSSHAGCQIVLEKCGARNERAAIERQISGLRSDYESESAELRRIAEQVGTSTLMLTTEQAAYIGVPKEGPFKAEHYRY